MGPQTLAFPVEDCSAAHKLDPHLSFPQGGKHSVALASRSSDHNSPHLRENRLEVHCYCFHSYSCWVAAEGIGFDCCNMAEVGKSSPSSQYRGMDEDLVGVDVLQ